MRPGSPGRTKGGKQRSRGRFRPYRSKGRANQADGQEHPSDASYYGKGKGKGRDKSGKGKGKSKGKEKATKEGPTKEQKKEGIRIRLSSHPQHGIKRMLPLKPMKPPHRTELNGMKAATMLVKDGALPYMNTSRIHTQHLPHAERHGKRKRKEEQKGQKAEAQIRICGKPPCQTLTSGLSYKAAL